MNSNQRNLIGIAILLNRVALGLMFVFAGVRKLMPFETIFDNWSGFASFTASKAPVPELLGKAYGYALVPAEIVLGAALMIGIYSRISAALIALMLLSFIIAMGIGWWPDSGPAFDKNVILLTLALLLAATGSGKIAVKPDGPLD